MTLPPTGHEHPARATVRPRVQKGHAGRLPRAAPGPPHPDALRLGAGPATGAAARPGGPQGDHAQPPEVRPEYRLHQQGCGQRRRQLPGAESAAALAACGLGTGGLSPSARCQRGPAPSEARREDAPGFFLSQCSPACTCCSPLCLPHHLLLSPACLCPGFPFV